jgi:hypothetical protein
VLLAESGAVFIFVGGVSADTPYMKTLAPAEHRKCCRRFLAQILRSWVSDRLQALCRFSAHGSFLI